MQPSKSQLIHNRRLVTVFLQRFILNADYRSFLEKNSVPSRMWVISKFTEVVEHGFTQKPLSIRCSAGSTILHLVVDCEFDEHSNQFTCFSKRHVEDSFWFVFVKVNY